MKHEYLYSRKLINLLLLYTLSTLPPCKSEFQNLQCTFYIANLWRTAHLPQPKEFSLDYGGRNGKYILKWFDGHFQLPRSVYILSLLWRRSYGWKTKYDVFATGKTSFISVCIINNHRKTFYASWNKLFPKFLWVSKPFPLCPVITLRWKTAVLIISKM